MRRLILLALMPLAACAYDPHMRPGPDLADTTNYPKDLSDCRAKAATDADQIVARHGYTWVVYWITYPLEERRQLRLCLTERGYQASK